jgi:hypothetical protein
MNVQRFKNLIGKLHEIELSNALGVPLNDSEAKGVDLLDNIKGVEVKGCLIDPNNPDYRKRYSKWTMFDYQLSWDAKYDVPLYCAVGNYQLDIPVSRIWTADPVKLESHVTDREFWVVPWDWTMGFPIKEGKCHNYRYLRRNPASRTGIPAMPGVKDTRKISKGLLYFVEGVDMDHF